MDCSDKKECREKKAAIIKATVELVSEHGFHGAPMAMVAERAAVAAGTIYRYFENKDALITGTYKDVEERLQAKVMQGFPEQGTPREKFSHFARVLVNWWIASPVEFRFMEQFHNSPYGVARRRDKLLGKQRDLCWDIFNEALEQHEVKDLPLPILFGLAFGPLVFSCRDHNHGFITLDDTMIEQTIEGCWNAIKR